jgi:hypothetical protein
MTRYAAMPRQHFSPSCEEQTRMLDRIVQRAPVKGAKARILLEFLFKRSMEGRREPIVVKDILMACEKEGGPANANAMNTEINRVKGLLARFFDARREGDEREPVRADLEGGTHRLIFSPNWPASPLVEEFWSPYFHSMFPTCLYYPEPQFFRYRNNVYIRYLESNSPDEHKNIEKLLRHGSLSHTPIPSHSFVPSGLVAAMSRLFECFLGRGTPLRSEVLGWSKGVPADKNNVIILGTPTTNLQLINSVEREWPMRTEKKLDPATKALKCAVIVSHRNSTKSYLDQTQEDDDSVKDYVGLEKWACLTRRVDASGRVITVLSGHSRSVQGLATFLTMERHPGHFKPEGHLGELKRQFPNGFPLQLQACFSVTMQKLRGELELQATTVKEAIGLDPRES